MAVQELGVILQDNPGLEKVYSNSHSVLKFRVAFDGFVGKGFIISRGPPRFEFTVYCGWLLPKHGIHGFTYD
ncbi:unnamed protein product [Clonostachys solani]|uniref:Uncharacterized protein n=1 Tax=Clonostachys solani TaxID=160281 RepID=A0A9N9ZF30_9HYPO|nr:unnamed protein product [Clonostachys solani]